MADTQKQKKTTQVACIITGKTTPFTKEYLERKVNEYGSEEMLHQKYICKQAKSMLKRGYTIQEVQGVLGASNIKLNMTDEQIKSIVQEKDSENFNISQPVESVNIAVQPHIRDFIDKLKKYNG